jgi:hypothetical protein
VDTFIARQTNGSRSGLPADKASYTITCAIFRGVTVEDLEISLNPGKNERYTGVVGDERRRLLQVFKQQVDGIKLAKKGLLDQMQYVTVDQGLSLPTMTSTRASLDDLTQPTEAARLALNLESLVSETKIDMKTFIGEKARRDESVVDG